MYLPFPIPRGSFVFVAIVLLTFSTSGFAALGGDVSSVQADQARMRAQRRVTQTSAYSLHEMQAQGGTVVREFVSPQGKVFGVSWHGSAIPDLQELLGPYYAEFVHAAPTRRSHGPVSIQTPNFIIQSGGHQRALAGRAYVPEMLPEGVRAEEIQ
jgi:uncharacterized protein DUF2844